jgi:uncharacterized protein with gpF-like domain
LNEIARKHIRVMDRFERAFMPSIYKAVNNQLKTFMADLRQRGIDEARRNMDKSILNDEIVEPIKELYKVVGHYSARRTIRELKGHEQKGFGFNPEWIAQILQWFNSYALTKIVLPITETTKRQILEVLREGQQKGWGADKMAREIEGLPMWRARLIVRTEIATAMFIGDKIGEKETPFESTEMWIAADDHRTRRSHDQMDGKVINTGERFVVPIYKKFGKIEVQTGVDLMEGPGDPRAHIENLANCRCTKVRRLKKENGRLVRKRVLV